MKSALDSSELMVSKTNGVPFLDNYLTSIVIIINHYPILRNEASVGKAFSRWPPDFLVSCFVFVGWKLFT